MAYGRDLLIGVLVVLAALYADSLLHAQRADQPNVGAVQTVEGAETGAQRLRFNFAKAPWLSVLEWFAEESKLDLDWRELPEDELNLITQRSYTITEAHDVINMHLLPRGFTLLRRDGVLFLVKLGESLNPTMVPRIHANELDSRPSYEYAKVSFPLDWMVAEAAAKELRPILSPFGKIIPLSATNRIEAMDAVVNLRELRDLLTQEQSGNSQQRLVAEFTLEHARAVDVISKLHTLLGMEQRLDRMSRDQMRTAREQYAFRAELAKRMGDKAPQMRQGPTEVFLVANERKNSILANAPPDKIAVIRQAVLALDVPTNDQGVRLDEITTMKVYPLNGADADAVADLLGDLRDIGELHPNARFTEDDDRQILFAYASMKDHVTIQSVMDQLAGSARTFQVIPLRRLKATYVAQSIQTLMGGEQTSGDDDGRRRRGRTAGSSWRGFRVEADPPHNRLFMFATEAESKQVEELLIRIGERSAASGKIRVLDAPAESVDQVLNQLQRIWPSVSSNPLQIDLPGHRKDAEPQSTEPRQRSSIEHETKSRAWPNQRRPQEDLRTNGVPAREARNGQVFVSLTVGQDEAIGQYTDSADSPNEPHQFPPFESREQSYIRPPVTITQSSGGELILRSDDGAALDQLEQALIELLPQRKAYALFQLSHVSPYSLQLKLQEIFATSGVEATMPLRFVADENTKSLMVFGAGKLELRQIQDYIDLYDHAPAVDPEIVRTPRFFQLRHAKAADVASVIKDIYRDVLSPFDRERRQPNDRDRERAPVVVPVADPGQKRPQFKGMLSVGVFPVTNTLVVSAPEYLSNEIGITIEGLDQPDASEVTRVVKLSGRASPAHVAQELSNLLSPTTRPISQPQQGNQPRASRDSRQERSPPNGTPQRRRPQGNR